MLGLGSDKSEALHRQIVDNCRGQFNSMLDCRQRSFLDYYKDWRYSNSYGVEVANFIGVCQCRDGYESNDNCLKIREDMRTPNGLPTVVRRIIHACLLQPAVDFNEVVDGINQAMTGATRFVAKGLVVYSLSADLLKELIQTLAEEGLSVDDETATQWIEFCRTRSRWFDSPESSEKYSHLYKPVFL